MSSLIETLERARVEIVLTIAFLGRDAGSDRLQATIAGLIPRLAEADKAILDVLSNAQRPTEREELLQLIRSSSYKEPADGTAESAWNFALEHIEEGLAQLPVRPAQAGTERPVEVWNGDRKVSVYDDIVVRLDGPNNGSIGMSEQPRSHESVGEAFKWLFEAAPSSKQPIDRNAVIEECAKVCEDLRHEDYSCETSEWSGGTFDCARAVRALAVSSTQSGSGK